LAQRGGDPALRVLGVGFGYSIFCEHRHAAGRRQRNCCAQPGYPAPYHYEISPVNHQDAAKYKDNSDRL
jgi:hypothetical protein